MVFAPNPPGPPGAPPFTWYYDTLGAAPISTNQFNFESTALHELGHLHLLEHVLDSTLMYYASPPGNALVGNITTLTNDPAKMGGDSIMAVATVPFSTSIPPMIPIPFADCQLDTICIGGLSFPSFNYEYDKLCDAATGELRLQMKIYPPDGVAWEDAYPINISGDYNALIELAELDTANFTFVTDVIDNSDGSNDFQFIVFDALGNGGVISGGIFNAAATASCLPNGYELNLSLANGQAPYTFQYGDGLWATVTDTFFTTPCPLHGSTYQLLVTDADACRATLSGSVQTMQYTLAENCDPLTGELTLSFDFAPAGATLPITYNINGNVHTGTGHQFTTPVLPYDYNIQITDGEGCGTSLSGSNGCAALSCNDNSQQDAGELGLDCGFGANCPQCLPLTFDLTCNEDIGEIEVVGYLPTDTSLITYPLYIYGTFSSEEYYDTTFNFSISDGQLFNIFVEDATGRRGAITTSEIVDCTKDVDGGECSGGQVTLSEGNVYCSPSSPDLYMVEILIDGSPPYKIIDAANDSFIDYGTANDAVVVGPYPMGSAYSVSVLDADTCIAQISGTPPPCPSCNDGVQNQGETAVDCGGPCPACPPAPTCHNYSGYDEPVPAVISLCSGELISGGQVEVYLSPPMSECPLTITHNGNPVPGTSITGMSPGNCHEIGIWEDGQFLYSFGVVVNAEYLNDDDLQITSQTSNQLGTSCNGGLNLEVSGGSGLYNYSYSANCEECNGCDGCPPTNVQSNLCAGNYSVTVTDMLSGCTKTLGFEVESKVPVIVKPVLIRFVLEGGWIRDTLSSTQFMHSTLRTAGLLPISQPYNRPPWNYNGTEAVDSLAQMPETVVDWVLVEARHKKDANTITDRAAGLLLDDGNIVTPTGEPFKFLQLYENEEYYMAVRHRNHLAVMSAEAVLLPDTACYDFTESLAKAMGREQMRYLPAPDALYVLCAGDANADGTISTDDYNQFSEKLTAVPGYYDEDVNLDGIVDWGDFGLLHQNASAIGIWQLRH